MIQTLKIFGGPVYVAQHSSGRSITVNGCLIKHFIPRVIPMPENDRESAVA